jgi:hypothetical protein
VAGRIDLIGDQNQLRYRMPLLMLTGIYGHISRQEVWKALQKALEDKLINNGIRWHWHVLRRTEIHKRV